MSKYVPIIIGNDYQQSTIKFNKASKKRLNDIRKL
jgi:hypothetical protein